MKRVQTFAAKRFYALFTAASIGLFAEYARLVSDTLIGGRFLGQNAIAGITLVTPFYAVTLFFAFMVSVGTTVLMAQKSGEVVKDKNAESELFTQGLFLTFAVGTLTTLVLCLFQNDFQNLFFTVEGVKFYAVQYYKYVAWLPVPLCLSAYLYSVLMTQGNEKICLCVSIFQIVFNIVLSVFLCAKMGAAGLSLGTLIATLTADFLYLFHFKTKRNTLFLKWYLNFKSVLKILKIGTNDALEELYVGILLFALNLILIRFFDASALVVLGVVFNLHTFVFVCNDAFDESILPLACVGAGMRFFSLNGVWIGLSVSNVLGIFGCYLFGRIFYPQKTKILLLDNEKLQNQAFYNFKLSAAEHFFALFPDVIRADIKAVCERLKSENTADVLVECSIFRQNDGTPFRVIMRDDGLVLSLSDDRYAVSGGYNRFVFELKAEKSA